MLLLLLFLLLSTPFPFLLFLAPFCTPSVNRGFNKFYSKRLVLRSRRMWQESLKATFPYGGLEGMLPQKIVKIGVIYRNNRRQ